MGADGHVMIYDLEKIKTELSDEEIKPLLNSMVYIQEMQGRKYLTLYYGDNLYFDGASWQDMMRTDYKEYDWYVTRDEWERRWGIIRKYLLAEWEVWT